MKATVSRICLESLVVIICCSLAVFSNPAISQNSDIHHRTRRRSPTRSEIDVVVEWLKRNLPAMGMELCNEDDPYEGIRCPGTDEEDGLCAKWDEICDGVQKCGLRKRELCLNNEMETGYGRETAEDKCSGEEAKDVCIIKIKEPPRCGKDFELTADSRYIDIVSPQFPNSYPGDMHCFWRVKGPPDSKITVEFLSFNTEANYDYINLGKGHKCEPSNRMNYAVYKHSGPELPEPAVFTLDTNEIFASFYSDYHDYGNGFQIRVSLANDGDVNFIHVTAPELNTTCGGRVNIEENGQTTITSNNYPQKYDNLFQCDWRLMLPKGRRFGIKFKDFVTEKGADTLTIGRGRKAGEEVLYSFSGNSMPEDILIIESSKAWIRFITDDSNRRKGFKLHVFDYPINDCGGEYEVPRDGSVAVASPLYPFTAYRLNQQCLWIFKISNGRKLSIKFDEFSLSYDDILSVGSGPRPAFDWSNYIIEAASGRNMPKPKRFYTGKNAVWFYFRSNDARVDRGFKAEIFDSKLYKPKKRPKLGKKSQVNADCGGEIAREDIVDRIVIQSPNYPSSYGPLMECVWVIDIPFGGDIRLKFDYLSLEKHLDILTIGNGTNPNKKKSAVMTFSGFETPPVFEGKFNQMWIKFNSDILNQYGGFSMRIEPRPYTGCGGDLVVPASGSLAVGSPNYPDIYPPNLICRYVVRGPLHHRLAVSIAGFETEAGKDTLTVSEGCPATHRDGRNIVLYEHSGLGPPINYQSLPRSDSIWVEFKTDGKKGLHGFLLNFADTPLKAVTADGMGCPVYNRTDPAVYIAGTELTTET